MAPDTTPHLSNLPRNVHFGCLRKASIFQVYGFVQIASLPNAEKTDVLRKYSSGKKLKAITW